MMQFLDYCFDSVAVVVAYACVCVCAEEILEISDSADVE